MAVTQMVGARIQRREDPKLISGHGRFVDDVPGRGPADERNAVRLGVRQLDAVRLGVGERPRLGPAHESHVGGQRGPGHQAVSQRDAGMRCMAVLLGGQHAELDVVGVGHNDP